ncbi:MAG: TonB-dependent receptor [Novosphingobium sp.]
MYRESHGLKREHFRAATRRMPLLLASAAALWSPMVQAQGVEPGEGSAFGPIVVTAERREASVNDVGIAIQAFGAEELLENQVDGIDDLSQMTANINFRQSRPGGNPVITIRGVGTNDFLVSSNGSTAVYFDGVYSPSLGTISGQLFDLERAEVLKGPQSALYGRNATAGVVNVISAKPTDYFTGYLRLTAGNYETVAAEGAVSGPLGDKVSGRLSVRTNHSYDGYMTNLYPGGQEIGTIHKTALRAQLLAQPTDNFSLHAIFTYEHENSVPGGWTSFGRREPGGSPTSRPFKPFCATDLADMLDFANECASSFGYQRETTDVYTINENDPWDTRGDAYTGTLIAKYEGDGFTITSTTGYIDWYQFRYQADSIPFTESLVFRDQKQWQLSEDLLIASAGDAPFQWLGGVFLSTGNVTIDRYIIGALFNSNTIVTHDADTRTVQPYLQLDYKFSPAFSVSAGARYIYEYNDKVGGVYTDANFDQVLDPDDVTNGELDDSMSQEQVTYKLAANFTPSDHTLVYASFTHGFKSGGYTSAYVANTAGLLPYKGEKIDAYEVGLKQTFGSVAQFNAAAFYYDYTDIQSTTTVVINGTASSRFANIPKAEVKGVDLELSLWPIEGLTLNFNAGFLDTEVGSYLNGSGATVPKGNRLPNAPKFSGAARFRYETPVSDSVKLWLTGSVQHHGKYYMDVDNAEKLASASKATLVDGSIGLNFPNANVDVSVWAKNLFDEAYILGGYANGSVAFMQYNMPRTFGITLGKSF